MATAMAATAVATMAAVAATKTMVATAMVGDTDINQVKGAAEKTTTVAMATTMETATVPCY